MEPPGWSLRHLLRWGLPRAAILILSTPRPWHRSHRSGPKQIHSLSSCLLSWTGTASAQEKLQVTPDHGSGRSRKKSQGQQPPAGSQHRAQPRKAWLPPPVNTAVPSTGRINKELCTSAFPTPASTVCTQHFIVGWLCLALGFFDSF